MPKHSKVKRQTSTPNASDLEQQPEINIEEWFHKPTYEIIQKFNVSLKTKCVDLFRIYVLLYNLNLFSYKDCDCLASQAQLASILLKKEGPDFFDGNGM